MTRARQIEPEILDGLPEDDPRALRSRRDLRLLNTLMLHPGLMARALLARPVTPPPRSLLDLGAGDGAFTFSLARRLAPRWPGVTVTLLDRQDAVTDATLQAFADLGWQATPARQDVIAFLENGPPSFDVVTANLFLHHLDDETLARMFRALQPMARIVAVIEPRRAAFPLFASRMIWAVGANDVSRHDAPASVRAGFTGSELSRLWPDQARWSLDERAAGLFSHRFVARRLDGAGPLERADAS